MKLRFLQLNIEGGRFLDAVIQYIKDQDIDIAQLQEVSGGKWNKGIDTFPLLKQSLGFEGELTTNFGLKGDPQSYFGSATFYRPSFKKLSSDVHWMLPYKEYETTDTQPYEQVPRNLLSLRLEIDGKTFTSVNTHLMWAPTSVDSEAKQAQHKILLEYMKTVPAPFILSGDFNVEPNSWIVKNLNSISRDLAKELGYPNTLNPNTHYAKHLFPVGTPVDYIFTSPGLGVPRFRLVDTPDLSDHLGIYAEIEI